MRTLDTMSAAELLHPTRLLVVHGHTDAYCLLEAAQAVFERASEPKEILWLDTTNHIDLYDVEERRSRGAAARRVLHPAACAPADGRSGAGVISVSSRTPRRRKPPTTLMLRS